MSIGKYFSFVIFVLQLNRSDSIMPLLATNIYLFQLAIISDKIAYHKYYFFLILTEFELRILRTPHDSFCRNINLVTKIPRIFLTNFNPENTSKSYND